MLFFAPRAWSQSSARSNKGVTKKLVNYFNQTLYDSALAIAEAHADDPGVMNNSEFQFYSGLVYKEMYRKYQKNNPGSEYRTKSETAFEKVLEIEHDSDIRTDVKKNLAYLAATYHNDAVRMLEDEKPDVSGSIYQYGKYIDLMKLVDPNFDENRKQSEFLNALGSVYATMFDNEKDIHATAYYLLAKSCYQKVLTYDPENATAKYNMLVLETKYKTKQERLLKEESDKKDQVILSLNAVKKLADEQLNEARLKDEAKKKELTLLKAEQDKKDLEAKAEQAKKDGIIKVEKEKEKAIIVSTSIGLIIVLVFISLLYSRYKITQSQKKEIEQQQKLMEEKNHELESKNTKIEVAYKELAASEQKFKLITETIDDVFYLYNIEKKKYEYISPNCSTLFGYSNDFFYAGNSMKIPVAEEDLPLVIRANETIDSGKAYEIEYRIIVGEEIKWVAEKSSPIFDSEGKLKMNSGICRNITGRKTNEEIIKRKNQDINDSIVYASNIQHAILAPKEEISKKLKDFFILSKPKDIVSGDFYFYRETKYGIILALADCTGHGVPGGFMSMLGNALLNDITSNTTALTAAEILNKLKEMVIRILNQSATYSSNKDGMDIALLIFDNKMEHVQYAGANIPLHIYRNGELQTILTDKLPIGISLGADTGNFTNHKIKLEKGNSIYLLSDGYADQFGGPYDKKFSRIRLKELLSSIQNKKMEEQEHILNRTFEDWKGNSLQIDDVMALGVKV